MTLNNCKHFEKISSNITQQNNNKVERSKVWVKHKNSGLWTIHFGRQWNFFKRMRNMCFPEKIWWLFWIYEPVLFSRIVPHFVSNVSPWEYVWSNQPIHHSVPLSDFTINKNRDLFTILNVSAGSFLAPLFVCHISSMFWSSTNKWPNSHTWICACLLYFHSIVESWPFVWFDGLIYHSKGLLFVLHDNFRDRRLGSINYRVSHISISISSPRPWWSVA
jgi:hypothetical protein